ncbi:MAG TPA: hypothetical protein DEB46_03810 [Myxococcales bacterium]|nr:hypothetical protein [Myxococcales bacterium]
MEDLNPELLSAGWLIVILVGAAWRLRSLVTASGSGRQWIPWLYVCCGLTMARMGILVYRHIWSSDYLAVWVIPVIILLVSLFAVSCLSLMFEFVESPLRPKIFSFFVVATVIPLISVLFLRFDTGYGTRILPNAVLLTIPYIVGSFLLALYSRKGSRIQGRQSMVWGCMLACWSVCLSCCFDAFLIQQTGAAGVFTTGWVQSLSLIAIMLIAEGTLSREFVQRSIRTQAARRPIDAQSRIFAMVGHELRTPLTNIMGIQEALKDRLQRGDSSELVTRMGWAARRLSYLIDGVVTVERFVANRQVVDEKPFPLDGLFRAADDRGDSSVRWSRSSPLSQVVVGDERRLRQALNFLHYELESRLGQGCVQAEVKAETLVDDRVKVTFQMNAERISSEHDFKGEIKPLRSLTIAERLFQILGIQLTVHPGVDGSVAVSAEFRLPSVAGIVELKATHESDLMTRKNRARKVLLVDDHAMNRRVLRLLLEPVGCEVWEAESGDVALRIASQQWFDAILIDLHMPGMTGLEVADSLQKDWRNFGATPIPRLVAWSADQRPELVASAYASGFESYLSKPYTRHRVFQILGIENAESLSPSRFAEKEHLLSSQFVLDLVGDDLSLAKELVEEFSETWRVADAQLTEAIRRRDWREVGSLAHRQRGGCLSMGLNEAASTAGQLQMGAGSLSEDQIETLMLNLRKQCESAGSSLNQLLADLDESS